MQQAACTPQDTFKTVDILRTTGIPLTPFVKGGTRIWLAAEQWAHRPGKRFKETLARG